MKTLKLTVPGAPTNWHAKSYVNQKSPLSNDWKIEVNTRILEADAWFVCEDLVDEEERCSVPSGMLFLGSAETSYEHDWIVSSKAVNAFYLQFDRVHTFNMFEPQKTVPSIPFLPWMLHANHGPSIFAQPGYQELMSYNPKLEDKQKRIALFCSNQDLTSGHRVRKYFAENLVKYFGDKIDWFGNGIQKVDTKYEVYSKYQYSIVLENQSRSNILTEKLGDAFLGYTFPFYWGAPNASDFYNPLGFEAINIFNFYESVTKIEEALAEDKYINAFIHIFDNRNRSLNSINFLHRILEIVDQNYRISSSNTRRDVTLNSISVWKSSLGYHKKTLTSNIYLFLRRLDNRFGLNLTPLVHELQVLILNNPLARRVRK